ncbi:MAG: phage terminase large subunit [Defluviitaleaceae bacterium]|nr:phage terminase large subunit [Defluviitaleaceae bacterium]MCL2273427.1 phage terminase large subunit [Defluviitaleaceae bacterium]
MNKNLFTEFKQTTTGKAADKYEAARSYFWDFCKLMNPKFYKDDRPHLKEIADTLQALYEGRIRKFNADEPWKIYTPEEIDALFGDDEEYLICKNMMLNIPPRHGKSYTLAMFAQWVFGKNRENSVITVSYNDTLATRFSAAVRDGIDATKIDKNWVIFNDVFPSTHIKDGDGAKQIWALEGSYFNYLGTGFGGTITGIGCKIGIIDDPVKNAEEAYNDNALEKQWLWYTDTFLSRIEEGGIQIINMTRWSTKDLCGRLQDSEDAADWYELKMKACLDEANKIMLCPSLMSFKSYLKKKRMASPDIHEANYQQEPVDVQGKLYTTIKTYTELPKDERGKPLYTRIFNYTDTANTGKDFLCSFNAVEFDGEAYIINALYSAEPMEVTEPELAKMLYEDSVNDAIIESNNGGRGFGRNVERILWETYRTKSVVIHQFYQSQNKQARILSNATNVMKNVYFPVNWHNRWPELYKAIMKYKAKGGNKFDDVPDALTGIAENIGEGAELEFLM